MAPPRLLLLLLLLLLPPGPRAQGDPALPFSERLDGAGAAVLSWGFDPARELLTLELAVNTSGWAGLGFSPRGDMVGADLVIGGALPDGRWYFSDRYSAGNELPTEDPQQDYTLLALTESEGRTVMRFRRRILSCDSRDFSITAGPVKVIYAYGLSDEVSYHGGHRGTKEINLLAYSPRSSPANSSHFDVTAGNFTVPALGTYYHCRIVRFPSFGGKNHIYRIEPLLQNLDLVHHVLLYRCSSKVNATLEGECYTRDYMAFIQCFEVLAAWAIGGEAFDLPPNAGMPVGGAGDVPFYRLEMHYNNPSQQSGRVDDSGLRFHYTPELRQQDAGVLSVGLAVNEAYVIPPNATAFRSYAVCKTASFSDVLSGPVADLNVYAVLLHTHLAGRKVRVGHFRNGEQIGFLGLNENYNFDNQQTSYLGSTVPLKVGDEIVVECTYETKNRKVLTPLGLASVNEMCIAFLHYSPATKIKFCNSLPDITQMAVSLGTSSILDAYIKLNTMIWNDNTVEQFQNILKTVPQNIYIDSSVNTTSFRTTTGLVRDVKATPSPSCRAASGAPGGTGHSPGAARWGQAARLGLLGLAALYRP